MTLAGLESQQIGLKQQMGAVIQPPERNMAQSDLSTKMAITQMTFNGEGNVRGMIDQQMKLGRADLDQIMDRMSKTSDPEILAQLNRQKNEKMREMAGMQQQLENGWTERLVSQAFNTPGSGRMSMSQFTRRESSMFAGAYAQAFGGTQAQTARMRDGFRRLTSDVGDTPTGNMNRAMAGAQRTPTDFDRVMNSGGGSGAGGGGNSSSPSSHVDSKAAFSDISGAMEGLGSKLSGAVHGTGSTTIGGGSAGMGAHYLKQLDDTSGDNDIARGAGSSLNPGGLSYDDVTNFAFGTSDFDEIRRKARNGGLGPMRIAGSAHRLRNGEMFTDEDGVTRPYRGDGPGDAGGRNDREISEEMYRRKARGFTAGLEHSLRQGGIKDNFTAHGMPLAEWGKNPENEAWLHPDKAEAARKKRHSKALEMPADTDNPFAEGSALDQMRQKNRREAYNKAIERAPGGIAAALARSDRAEAQRIEVIVKLQDQQGKELGRGNASTHVNVAHSQKGQTDKGNHIPYR
jgi:hypothetical protein